MYLPSSEASSVSVITHIHLRHRLAFSNLPLVTDIGQGPTYLKYILEYLIVCILADQPGNQQILLHERSIKLPLKYWIW
jgi:hypothetical protein